MWLFLLLVAVPIIEIALFIQVGGAIGLLPTLGIVIATALAGTILLRSQGLATIASLQSSIAEGRNPVNPIAHGALILVAGVLLLTPGFFTDAVGLSLLVPPIRAAVLRAGAKRMTTFVHVSNTNGPTRPDTPASDEVVEGDYVVVDEKDPDAPPSGWSRNEP